MPANGEFVILRLSLPQRPVHNIGILLYDPQSGQVFPKLREDWDDLAEKGDAALLRHLRHDIELKIREMGGDTLLRHFEDTLSNSLLVTEREPVLVESFPRSLNRLFAEHVQESKVIPFRTHLPLYSLKAAATRFGEDLEVEQEDWIEAPQNLRLTREMFVARVVGRSMEPLIPDGSLCVFRGHVSGSRNGKRLLIQRLGASDSSAEFTVKRYLSRKQGIGNGQWEHSEIRLEPLNAEFEPMVFGPEDEGSRFRVLGEFVCVLDPAE